MLVIYREEIDFSLSYLMQKLLFSFFSGWIYKTILACMHMFITNFKNCSVNLPANKRRKKGEESIEINFLI